VIQVIDDRLPFGGRALPGRAQPGVAARNPLGPLMGELERAVVVDGARNLLFLHHKNALKLGRSGPAPRTSLVRYPVIVDRFDRKAVTGRIHG
jgi:hypothetical protein